MANRRDTFAKRQRESDLKERARAKEARRVAKRSEVRTVKGPEIATSSEVQALMFGGPAAAGALDAPGAASSADPADSTE